MFFHGTHKEILESIEAIGASFAVYEYESSGNLFVLISCNSLYEELLGKSKQKSIMNRLNVLFPRYVYKPLHESFIKCINEQVAVESEILLEYKATERWWRSITSPITEKSENRIRIIQTCVEITEKKLLEKQLNTTMKRYAAVVQSAYDGIITIDEDQNIKMINEAAKDIFGFSEEEVLGKPLTKLIPQKFRKKHTEYVDGFKKSLVDSRPMQSRASVRGLSKKGNEFPIEVTISKIQIEDNTEMTAVIRDISEKNKLLEELLIASQEDPLTNLYNRRYFSKALVDEIARSKRFNHGFVLMMIDIDHFKKFNDLYSHECGDRVLVSLAENLTATLRATDIICRWGGEEFLILLPEIDLKSGMLTAEKIRVLIEESELIYNGEILKTTVSIGVHYSNPEDSDLVKMINDVDKAMYKSKTNGRNKVTSG